MKVNPFPWEVTKQGCSFVLTAEQKDWLRTYFPIIENNRLMKMSGLTTWSLHRFAKEHGLKKSEEGLRKIWKRRAQKGKRTCEKNGYYDSIRGDSSRCTESRRLAIKKMWQEIREGKRESPVQVWKRKHPRQFRSKMKENGEAHKEKYRKERLRLSYGMRQQTNLYIVFKPYKRSQVMHRQNALRRGYLLAEDCSEQGGERWNIYYDDQTQRSEQFEKNLVKDGFRVLRDE